MDISGSTGGGEGSVGKDLFHFHTGSVCGLAADVTSARRLCATVSDDRWLLLWDLVDRELLAEAALKVFFPAI